MIFLGLQLGLRVATDAPWEGLSHLFHPNSSIHTSIASSLWMTPGREAGSICCMLSPPPFRQGVAMVGARRILFTATSVAQAGDLDSRLDLSRMWSSGRCQIVIIVRYNFLPLPLPLHRARGVHLFMETTRSWLGIFRQSLCWAGATSHQSPTCQHCPGSLLHLFVVKSLIIYKTTKPGAEGSLECGGCWPFSLPPPARVDFPVLTRFCFCCVLGCFFFFNFLVLFLLLSLFWKRITCSNSHPHWKMSFIWGLPEG